MEPNPERRTLVERWERLRLGVQIAVVLPVSVVVLYVAHVTVLNQPQDRAILYGVFWGLLATFAIVAATRAERARREAGRRPPPRRGAP